MPSDMTQDEITAAVERNGTGWQKWPMGELDRFFPSLLAALEQSRAEVERLEEPDERFRAMFQLDVERGDAVAKAERRAEAAEARITELEAENARLKTGKRAPVQGWAGGIPWDMHLRAYEAYCDKYSPQPALVDLAGRNCRGGFSTGELDDFIPGWRDELSERKALKAERDALEAQIAQLIAELSVVRGELNEIGGKWIEEEQRNAQLTASMSAMGEALEELAAQAETNGCVRAKAKPGADEAWDLALSNARQALASTKGSAGE